MIRDELVQQLRARSGRDVTVAGPTSFSLFPSPAITIRDVALSPPPGMGGRPAVTAELIEARVSVAPLWQRRVEIERLILRRPVIELRVDKEGRSTWERAETAPARRTRLAQAGQTADDWSQLAPELRQFVQGSSDARNAARGRAGRHAAAATSSVLELRVEDGTLRYVNERAGVTSEVTSLDLQLGFDSLTENLRAAGSLVWRAEKLDFDASVPTPVALRGATPSAIALRLAGRPGESKYEGSLRLGSMPELDGALTVKAASVRDLARWLGLAVPNAQGHGPLALSASLKTNDSAVVMSDLNAAFDGAIVTGSTAIETKSNRPYVTADLRISELDFQRSAPLQPGEAGTDRPPAEGGAAVDSGVHASHSIEDLWREPELSVPGAAGRGPRVEGYTQRTGWSDKDLDLSWLGSVDADAKLVVGRVLLPDIRVGETQLTLALKNRVLSASLDEVRLYEGRGRGTFSIDATGKVPGVGGRFVLEGVSALPLLQDAAGFDWIAGTGKVMFAVRGQGLSERQIVESLSGTAQLAVEDGAIVGIDIAKIVRGLQQGRIPGLGRDASEKTGFSELAANFTIANGVAENRDLRLSSPLLRVAGAGTVRLPERQLDFAVRPKLVANPSGEGGAQEQAGIELPMKITGPWDKPKIAADFGAVLKDTNQVVESVKKLGKRLRSKEAKDALRNLLGGGSGQDGAPRQKPSDVLKQLLKPQ